MPTVRNIHRLIEFFSSFTVLPIDPDDVRDQILTYGSNQDRIEFCGVTIDRRIIYGAFHQYIKRSGVYTDKVVCVDVYYDQTLPRDWKRLVCCKELLHILDHSVSKTASRQDCEKLVAHMAVISPDTAFSEEKMQAWNDTLMMWFAIAVLFPWDARQILYNDYVNDPTILPKIVEAVDLPEPVVSLVMSDQWPRLYQVVSGSN